MDNHFPSEIESTMVEHMNTDHQDAIEDYCHYLSIDITAIKPSISAIMKDGFVLKVGATSYKHNFDSYCETEASVRMALVQLAKKARLAKQS